MARDFAKPFYDSERWRICRAAYIKSKSGLCERCLARGVMTAGVIVHHKKHISPDNIHDPSITLNFNNLILLCRDCHAEMHKTDVQTTYIFDAAGNVIETYPPWTPEEK